MSVKNWRRQLIGHVRVMRPQESAKTDAGGIGDETIQRLNERAIVVMRVNVLHFTCFNDLREASLFQKIALADERYLSVADEGCAHSQTAPALRHRIQRDLLASRERFPERGWIQSKQERF